MFSETQNPWMSNIATTVPSYGTDLNSDASATKRSLSMTAKTLKLKA